MPNITPYDAGNLGLQPSEIGVESMAAAGRRLGVYGSQIADVRAKEGAALGSTVRDAGQAATDYMTHRAISAKSVEAANMFLTLDQQWNDTVKKADPNDPTVAAKFREEVLEPTLDRFNTPGGITTEDAQAYTDGVVNKYRQHFFQKTAADMSTMAGIAAKQNATESINKLSSAVYMDPSSLNTAIDTLKHSSDHTVDSSPTIDADTGARVKAELNQKGIESLVKAAAMGSIEKNPNFDIEGFAKDKRYSPYINAAELKQFQKAAIAQEKTNRLIDRQLEIAQQRQQEQTVAQGRSKIFTDGIKFDPATNRVDVDPNSIEQLKQLEIKYPGVDTAANKAMMDWFATKQKGEEAATDPATKQGLTDRLFSADHPTTITQILMAENEGKLSTRDGAVLRELVKSVDESTLKGPVWQDTISAVKGELILSGVGIPGKDIVGQSNYAKWAQTFIPQYIAMQRAGTLPPNALDVKDPTSMISQSMQPFRRTIQQRTQDYISALGGGAAVVERPRISTKAEYDKLPVGAQYISAKDGQTYEKR